MAKCARIFSVVSTLTGVHGFEDSVSLLQSHAKLQTEPDLSLAPQGWSDAFLQEVQEVTTGLSLAPEGWSDAQNKIDAHLKLAPEGFLSLREGMTDDSDLQEKKSGFFEDCGSTLHHVTECNQCGINFCSSGMWQANTANIEAGYAIGNSVPLWGCDNVPANPYVVRNSGSGAIYVVADDPSLATQTLHHVTACTQCGVNFCASSLWKKNSAYATAGFSTGNSLPDWGCSSLPGNPWVVRNSGNGAIYVAEMHALGTLHHVTTCNQCGQDFCSSSLWKQNSGNAEAGYNDGAAVPDWGCSNVQENPYVIRNSGTGAIYVVEMASAGTLHHVTSCNQCGVAFCGSGLWQENSASAVAGYTIGNSLPDWGCSNLPQYPYVIRDSSNGAIYVAETCENTPVPATTTTTTVVSVDGLNNDVNDDYGDEQQGEIDDQQQDVHECAKWCSSKKHKNKPWSQKCEWYSCSGCSECSES